MGKRKSRPRNRCGFDGEVYWGAFDYNRRLYEAYLSQAMQLALTRYEWRGLPATVDQLYLERILLVKGQATIAFPESIFSRKRGLWYAAKVSTDGPLNVYDRPSKWTAYSRELLHFRCSARNGVIVYDNVNRAPLMDALDLAVRELVDVQKTKQVNRFHQKVPFILVTDPDMELSATNLIENIMAGEPATVANPAIMRIEPYKLDMRVPYIGAELTAAEANIWNRIYTLLGIDNVTFKTERMIEDEVTSMSKPALKMRLSGLIERRRAADFLNERFGLEVDVIWREDNHSENVNLLDNVEQSVNLLTGDTKGLLEVSNNAD